MPQDPESSTITTRPPLAKLTGELVQPPSRVYIGVNDRLYIRSRNSLTGVRLQVAGRLLTAGGDIVPFNFDHVPGTSRGVQLEGFILTEGYLLSVVVFPSVGAPRRGQTFVELGLLRGRDVEAAVVDVLARDYVSVAEPLAFPGMPIRSSLEGPGFMRSITGTDPAAGVEVSEAVPANAKWLFHSLFVELVTDATAANRVPSVEFTDGTNVFFRGGGQVAIASTTTNYTYAGMGEEDATASSRRTNPTPAAGVPMSAGFVVRTATLSLQAGDDWAAPQLLVEEWIQD